MIEPAQTQTRTLPYMLEAIGREAGKRGISFKSDVDFGHVAQLGFPDGTVRHVLRRVLDVNGIASSTLATERETSLRLLKRAGLAVPDLAALEAKEVRGAVHRVLVFDGRVRLSFAVDGDQLRLADLSAEALAIALEAARLSGLRLASIEGIVPEEPGPALWIVGVDGACDLEAYAALGEEPARQVDDLASAILDALSRPPTQADRVPPAVRPEMGSELPEITTLADRMRELAPERGISVESEPERPTALKLGMPDGAIRHVLDEMTDLNGAASVAVARQKPWSMAFLQAAGFNVPPYETFFADWLAQMTGTDRNQAAALQFAHRVGFPVVVKPSGRLGGQGVFIAADAAAFERNLPSLLAEDPLFVVQKAVLGLEYRVVVLDGQVQIAYEKHALTVTGDGTRTLDALIAERLQTIERELGHVSATPDDFRVTSFLAFGGRTRQDVPADGERVRVMLNAGYGCGGFLVEAYETLPEPIAEAAIAITRHAGLRYSGIDIKGPDGPHSAPYYLIEVNSQPDLTGYSAVGPEQRRRAEGLIHNLLGAMGRR